LFLRKAARADLAEAFRWYEGQSTGLGNEFLRAVRVTPAAVARAPRQYPVAADDIRKARLRRFPYVVYFVVLRRGVSVIAVMHGRRDPRRWQSRR
jgi:plasmid stabilization system protein ParE